MPVSYESKYHNRPLCKCHREPMVRRGKQANGSEKWGCALKKRAQRAAEAERNRKGFDPTTGAAPPRKMGKLETIERLHLGHIPSDRVFAVLKKNGICLEKTMTRTVYRWKVLGYIPFQSVDKIFAKHDLVSVWYNELSDIYWRVNIGKGRSPYFEKQPRLHGGVRMYFAGCRCAACRLAFKEMSNLRNEDRNGKKKKPASPARDSKGKSLSKKKGSARAPGVVKKSGRPSTAAG